MLSFKEYLLTEDKEKLQEIGISTYGDSSVTGRNDFRYGHKIGGNVKINQPGHESHGATGRIIRQQANEFGVEVPGKSGLSWLSHASLIPQK